MNKAKEHGRRCGRRLSLVAAACGSDDGGRGSDGAATDGTADANVKQGVSDALTATTEGGATDTTVAPRPTTMEEWEELWAEERAAIVENIKAAGGTAADGTGATGPGGFTLDLTACPSGWSNTEGLTDTEIKIGHTTAQSGPLADYGNIAKAMQVQFDRINKAGGITDSTGKTRNISLIVKDDATTPPGPFRWLTR